jgi:predicted naringenin-chalcone synthase
LFADGAAAALVSSSRADSEGPSLSMHAFASFLIDDSEKQMAWRIGKHGFDMRLSLYVPKTIEANIHSVVSGLLDRAGAGFDDIDLFAIHPGGRAGEGPFSKKYPKLWPCRKAHWMFPMMCFDNSAT